VHFAVDPVEAVVDEAQRLGADLIVTHHPLFLRGTSTVAATTSKGRVVHRLIRSGMALHVAHTNADNARPGVSDALAAALGVVETRPLVAQTAEALDKIVTFVPHEEGERVVDALAAAGAGAIGDYSRCAWTVAGVGTFRPEPGAAPTIGAVGEVARVAEDRIEMVLPRARRLAVVAALKAAHPYEEPAYDVFELAAWPGERGSGRVGSLLQPRTLAEFAEQAASALPATNVGLRVAGDLDRVVRTVAVCGGAGDSYLSAATRAGVDVYVTGDLRHHPASEHLAEGGPALIDATHWASEWPWLREAATRLRERLAELGTTVETTVSRLVTDPWATHVAPLREESR
jgi:dinuclear metal center YbgI/SA1388 family protein